MTLCIISVTNKQLVRSVRNMKILLVPSTTIIRQFRQFVLNHQISNLMFTSWLLPQRNLSIVHTLQHSTVSLLSSTESDFSRLLKSQKKSLTKNRIGYFSLALIRPLNSSSSLRTSLTIIFVCGNFPLAEVSIIILVQRSLSSKNYKCTCGSSSTTVYYSKEFLPLAVSLSYYFEPICSK